LLFALIHCGPILPGLAEGVNRQVLPSFSRCSPTAGSRWRALARLAGGAGGNCAAAKPVRPRPTREKAAARQSPPNHPAKGRPSVGQHDFVIGHRVHIPTRFIGVGPCGARRGQAGRRVVQVNEIAIFSAGIGLGGSKVALTSLPQRPRQVPTAARLQALRYPRQGHPHAQVRLPVWNLE
jgi:hypothetical protein